MAYRYYSTRRPLMVGGIPSTESVTEIVNFESGRTYCEEIDNKAWGYIEYATPLDRNRHPITSWFWPRRSPLSLNRR